MEPLATQVNRSIQDERFERCAADITQSGTGDRAEQRRAGGGHAQCVVRSESLGSVLAPAAHAQGVAFADPRPAQGYRTDTGAGAGGGTKTLLETVTIPCRSCRRLRSFDLVL